MLRQGGKKQLPCDRHVTFVTFFPFGFLTHLILLCQNVWIFSTVYLEVLRYVTANQYLEYQFCEILHPRSRESR